MASFPTPPPTILDAGADTTDATSKTSASFTTDDHRLTVAIIHNTRASAPTLPTITDALRTWDQIATIEYDSIATPTKRLTVFRCMTDDTGELTFDFGGVTQTSFLYSILEFEDVEPFVNGASAVGQVVTGSTDSDVALALTLTSPSSQNNATFGVIARGGPAEDIIEGVEYMEVSDVPIDTPDAQLQLQWRQQVAATVDWSWTTAQPAAGVAIQIKAGIGPLAPLLLTTPGVAITPWVEISRRVASASYAVQTTAHAGIDRALNDASTYYSGRKHPDVMAFGEMFRELSDESGTLRDSSLAVTVQDVIPNRLWRTRVSTDVFKGQSLVVRTVDNVTRKAEGAPKIIARQLMKTPTFNADGSITFSGRGRIAALLSGATTELLRVPQIQITRAHCLNIASDDEYLNLGMPEIYGSHLNTSLGFGGPIPLLPLDYPYLLDSGLQYGFCLAMVGACQSMPEVRANNVVISDGASNLYCWPGSSYWNSQTTLDVGGNNVTYYTLPSGLRVTGIFVFGGKWSAVKSGQIRLTCTLHGVENSANGDGTGTVITSGPSQLLHWLKNRVFGSQWTTPLAAPVDPDGTPYIDTGSFTSAETAQVARLAGGYPLRWRVGPERITPDEQLAKVVRSMGAHCGETWEGSLMLKMFNRAQASSLSIAHSGTPTVLLDGSLEPTIDDDSAANQINYDYGELYDQSGTEISGAAIRDEASTAKYGRVYDSDVLSLPAVGDLAVAYDIAYHALKARTEPPHRYRGRVSLSGINAELGQTAVITHPFGLQSSAGVAAAKFWIEGIGHDIRTGDVSLVLLDQTRVASSLVITKAVTGITRVGNVATVAQTAHGYTTGRAYTIAGADQAGYNGTKIITVTGSNAYTFGVDDATVTPATGTITASTTDLGRMNIQVEKVDVKDKETKTGPIVTDEFDLGGSRDTALAPAANTDTDMVEARIAKIEKSDTGKRRVVARVWLDSGGSGTDVTPKIKTQAGTTIATGTAENDTSPTMYEILLQDFKAVPPINLLVAGTEDYKLTGRRNNTTNTFTMWGQINIL